MVPFRNGRRPCGFTVLGMMIGSPGLKGALRALAQLLVLKAIADVLMPRKKTRRAMRTAAPEHGGPNAHHEPADHAGANRAAQWLTYIALSAGGLTLGIWLAIGESFNFALSRMVTVMVITCPHALGLAVPLVVAVSTSLAAGRGLLIRDRAAFERARGLQAVVFDKTGTLTEGRFGVSDAVAFDQRSSA